MSKVAKARIKRIANYPWYELVEEFEWDEEIETPMLPNDYSCGRMAGTYDTDFSEFNGIDKEII